VWAKKRMRVSSGHKTRSSSVARSSGGDMVSRSSSLLLVVLALGSLAVAASLSAGAGMEQASRKGAQVCASRGERARAASWGVLASAQTGGTVRPLSALIKAAKVVRSALNSALSAGEGVGKGGVVVVVLLLLALMPVVRMCGGGGFVVYNTHTGPPACQKAWLQSQDVWPCSSGQR